MRQPETRNRIAGIPAACPLHRQQHRPAHSPPPPMPWITRMTASNRRRVAAIAAANANFASVSRWRYCSIRLLATRATRRAVRSLLAAFRARLHHGTKRHPDFAETGGKSGANPPSAWSSDRKPAKPRTAADGLRRGQHVPGLNASLDSRAAVRLRWCTCCRHGLSVNRVRRTADLRPHSRCWRHPHSAHRGDRIGRAGRCRPHAVGPAHEFATARLASTRRQALRSRSATSRLSTRVGVLE